MTMKEMFTVLKVNTQKKNLDEDEQILLLEWLPPLFLASKQSTGYYKLFYQNQ